MSERQRDELREAVRAFLRALANERAQQTDHAGCLARSIVTEAALDRLRELAS